MASYTMRRFKNRVALALGILAVIIALIPLGSILFEIVIRGLPAISWQFLTTEGQGIGLFGGGIANSIQGTLILIGLTSLLGIPLGVLSGIYLAEYGHTGFGDSIRFFVDVLAGVPAIVAGIVAYEITRLALHVSYSAVGAMLALSFLMIPIVTRTTEESLKLVPNTIREGSMALGIRRWRSTLSIVLVEGKGAVITGILLSIARIAGEAAPLLLTILGTPFFFSTLTTPMDALPLRIYVWAQYPYPQSIAQGWGAALVLIVLVLGLNVGVRVLTRGKYQKY